MALETTLHRRNNKTHPRLRQAQVKLLHTSEDWNGSRRVKCWEIIAAHLGKTGWTWGCSSQIDSTGRVLFTANAHRDNGKRFIEKRISFLPVALGGCLKSRRCREGNHVSLLGRNGRERHALRLRNAVLA